MKNREGQRVPDVTFRTREGDEWVDVSTQDLFARKTVCVFSLPGAFTPTCSASHLPRYEELADAFAVNGVDEIVCVSVNDAFVMNAWGRDQGAKRVRLIADGNADFTDGMGMLVDKRDLGFGQRSWRYSMLVRNGVIEKMFIEPDAPGDPYEVSDADTMLAYLNPDANAAAQPDITIFTRPGCGHCARAKALLTDRSLPFEEIEVGSDVSARTLRAVSGEQTVPQIFVDGRHVGGADAMHESLGA